MIIFLWLYLNDYIIYKCLQITMITNIYIYIHLKICDYKHKYDCVNIWLCIWFKMLMIKNIYFIIWKW